MYSEISIETVERFRMARYVVISPCPEDDVMCHMREWARSSGLLNLQGYTPKLIGWDFPFVSEEQKTKFGLRGYVAAYVIPEDFQPACDGAELAYQDMDVYAKITVTDPFSDPFTKIQGAYQKIYDYSREHEIIAKSYEGVSAWKRSTKRMGRLTWTWTFPWTLKTEGKNDRIEMRNQMRRVRVPREYGMQRLRRNRKAFLGRKLPA